MGVYSLREKFEVTSGDIIIREVICCLNVRSEMSILCAYVVSKRDFPKISMQLSILFLDKTTDEFSSCLNE